jgi:hypothetical protein
MKYLSADDVQFLFWWQQKAEKIITENEFWERVNGLRNTKTYTKLYKGLI